MEPTRVERPRCVAILGWGNPGRGDDNLGPLLIDRLAQLRPAHPRWPKLHLVSAHQMQIEHALDLEGCDLALFVDAAHGLREPYDFAAIQPNPAAPWSAHSTSPAWLLQVYRQALQRTPPPTFLLRIRGTSFHLGKPLTASARHALEQAQVFIESLLERCTSSEWEALSAGSPKRAA